MRACFIFAFLFLPEDINYIYLLRKKKKKKKCCNTANFSWGKKNVVTKMSELFFTVFPGMLQVFSKAMGSTRSLYKDGLQGKAGIITARGGYAYED